MIRPDAGSILIGKRPILPADYPRQRSGASARRKKIPLRNPEIPPLRDPEIRRLSRAVAAEKHPMISGPQPISGFRSAI
ncbi:hypothetical protein GFL84_30755 [Rhizobium leguminosarum bv. viciae]|nr:hypothetical protein [Rhizobium leguminosarum bv. viciae]